MRSATAGVQRVHERLTEEEGIQIGYSTLTRMIHELGMGRAQDQRCGQVADGAGSRNAA